MIGIDTNVLVRFLADDGGAQNAQARAVLSVLHGDDPAFVGSVALAETVWVLHRRLGFPMSTVAAALRDLLRSDGLIIEHGDELGRLLERRAAPDADIADYLINWAAIAAGCTHTVTFDRRAAKAIPTMKLLA